MKAINCAFYCVALVLCLTVIFLVVGVVVRAYWRAEGVISAIGILLLFVGIAYVGAWPRKEHD